MKQDPRGKAILEAENVIDARQEFADRFARNHVRRVLRDQLQESLGIDTARHLRADDILETDDDCA